jgi:hypothetical protein
LAAGCSCTNRLSALSGKIAALAPAVEEIRSLLCFGPVSGMSFCLSYTIHAYGRALSSSSVSCVLLLDCFLFPLPLLLLTSLCLHSLVSLSLPHVMHACSYRVTSP